MKPKLLTGIKLIVSHAHCADGTAAAMICKDALPHAKVRFMSYMTAELQQLPAEPGILFVDFSPPRDRANEFVQAGAIVLDHHVGTKDVVALFGDRGVYADAPGVSGALLAYLHVWLPIGRRGGLLSEDIVRDTAELVGVYDTWQRKSPRWEEACAVVEALRLYPQTQLVDEPVGNWPQLFRIGGPARAKQLELAQSAIDHGYVCTVEYHDRRLSALIIEGVRLASDAADLMPDKHDLLCAFHYKCEDNMPRLQVSCRTRRTHLDLDALAKCFGGGGHRGAAGWTGRASGQDPYSAIGFMLASGAEKAWAR